MSSPKKIETAATPTADHLADAAARAYENEAATQLTLEPAKVVEDPDTAHPKAQRVLDALREVTAQDRDPAYLTKKKLKPEPRELFIDADHGGAPLIPTIEVLLDRSIKAAASPEARVRIAEERTGPTPVASATEEAARTWRRLHGAADDGNEAATAERRMKLFGNRPQPVGKSTWEAENKLLLAIINEKDNNFPAAVKALVPKLEASLKQLEAARPQAGRNAGKEQWAWTPAVRMPVLALQLAVAKVLQNANGHASDERLAVLTAAAHGRRHGDRGAGEEKKGTGDQEKTTESKPEAKTDAETTGPETK